MMPASMCPLARMLLLVAMSACGDQPARDHGPVPAADHQAKVRELVDRVLDERHRLDGPSTYRFAAPVRDRVARWLFDAESQGQPQALGYVYGWSVEFWVTPRYLGYPVQPQSRRMAFFAAGQLRGIFSAGPGSAPFELDKWTALWVDVAWQPGRAQPPR